MLHYVMAPAATVVADVLAWGVFHAATGYAAHRLTDEQLGKDRWLLRPRRFEAGGRWYRRRLRINRWKDKLPEAGDLFGGMNKRHLPALDGEGLRVFARETRRAELAHWWAMWCGPLFALWNPPLATALLIGYGVAANLPFVMIQRYNRFRIEALLELRAGLPDRR
jgi:glycosyl-4,4'-diaponeurosporenoate acyltransferase